MTRRLKILVTGGGTGGHVSPALAVVQSVKALSESVGIDPEFLYVGSAAGVEGPLAAEARIPFATVACGKMRRSASLLGMFSARNIADAFRVPLGIVQALGIVHRFRPDVVFSTGGYVSVPAVVAAYLRHVPILAHEQTVQVGLANRISARMATRIALSYDSALADLPPSARARAFVSGNPVRPQILAGDPCAAARLCGFLDEDADLPVVYVTGGAQGAHVINTAVGDALPELLQQARVMHQCGRARGSKAMKGDDFTVLQAKAAALLPELAHRYWLTRFVGPEIGDVLALADLIVGRSGAGTVAEAAALGKPALYVPLVPTGGDEQRKNARRFVDIGAAIQTPSDALTGARLLADLTPLLSDGALRGRMGAAARTQAKPEAARDLSLALLGLADPDAARALRTAAAK